MDTTSLLTTLLTMVGVRLPVLIALCVGLVWVMGAPRDAARSGALWGLLLLLAASMGGLLAALIPMWMFSKGDFGSVSNLSMVLGIVHFLLSMLEAIGTVLLVWALVRMLKLRGAASP